MVKEKRILSYFIGWLILGFCIIFMGINNVFASEIIVSPTAKFYDNSGSSVSSVETEFENNRYLATFTTAADSYGALVTFQLNTTLQKGRIYTIFILAGAESNGGQTRASSKKYIGIGSNFNNANNSYINSNNETSYSASSGTTTETSRGVYYTFIANETGSYISVPYTTQYTCSNCRQYFNGYTLEDLGSSENLSQDEVNDIINSQTTIIQNNINDMQQSIVDSNKETQDVIKDQFNTCRPSINLLNIQDFTSSNNGITATSKNGVITLNGTATSNAFIYINVGLNVLAQSYTWSANNLTSNVNVILRFDNNIMPEVLEKVNQTKTFYFNSPTTLSNFVIRISSGATLENFIIKPQFQVGSVATEYEQFGVEICSNKIDETNDKLDETNNQLGDLNNNLTDSSPTDMSGLGDSAGWLPAGPVDSILTLPLTMLNSLVSNLSNNSCQTISIELPFVKENIILPCIKSLYDKMGVTGTLFSTAGLIASAFILFNYLLALYKWVDDTLTMRENTMPGYFDDNWGGGA